MGYGKREEGDEENPPVEDERAAERQKLNEPEGIELKSVQPEVPTVKEYRPPVVIGSNRPFLKTSYLKYALLAFNCILALLGLVILILAIWVRADPEFFQYDKTLNIKDFYVVCYLLIVVGVIILLVAFLGCFGVFVENQGVLTAYFVIYTIVFIIQLAALVLVFSAPYSKTMEGLLQTRIQKQIDKRDSDQSSATFMDFLQSNLKCCGASGQKNYLLSPENTNDGDIPRSCRNPKTGYVYREGCAKSLMSYLKSKAGVVGGVSIPILLIQLIALVLTFCLIYNIKKESKYMM